jgi:hypothetical protein
MKVGILGTVGELPACTFSLKEKRNGALLIG